VSISNRQDQTDPTRSAAARVISWCVDNRLLVVIMTVIVVIGGITAMSRTPLDAIPDLSDVQVIIYSRWPGSDPQTMEDQVTYPLSASMLAVPKVKAVRGYSFFGYSFVYAIFEDGTDIYWARSRVLEYLNQTRGQIPDDVEVSLGPDASGVGWVYQYTVEDRSRRYDLGDMRAIQDWYVRYQLMAVPGVAEVASIGGFVRQYQITVDPNLLQAYRVSLDRVIAAVKRSNSDVGGRLLEMSETEYMVRGRGYITGIEDIEKVVIKAGGESDAPVLLRDVARIQMGPDIRRGIAEKDGEGEVVGGIVVMRYGENALDVIDNVKKKIAEISAGLPEGVEIETAYDRSALIHRSIDTLRHELIQQMIIVALVCVLFLWHARSALVAAVSLPLGILVSFIVMRVLGINANIMSLGGIAIAIGAMVDAAVVLVENAHKHLERHPHAAGAERWRLIKAASVEVGPSLFFSLLIITVSFLPVFALQEQAGRLFKPLAYTKTFAMAAAAVIAVTLTPVLMGFFVRGKIHPEHKLVVSRVLISLYKPVIRWTLRHRTAVAVLAVAVLALTWFPYQKLGSEFMPPLNEGDILYMPTSIPGISETEAKRVLQTQDKLFKTFPEVDVVFGKIGRAETATDPAPLTMVETTVSLKDRDDWPERWIEYGSIADLAKHVLDDLRQEGVIADGATWDGDEAAGQVERMVRKTVQERVRKLYAAGSQRALVDAAAVNAVREELSLVVAEHLLSGNRVVPSRVNDVSSLVADAVDDLDINTVPMRQLTMEELMYEDMEQEFQFLGLTNAWTMPIKARTDMLSTGIKTPIGIKIFGDDLETLERLAVEVESVVKGVPGTLSAIAERVMGGNYIDFDIDRYAVARHGLTVGDVQDVIETAVGGKNVTQTVEGRYRFPVNVRYPRELRDDPHKLGRVLVHTPAGEQVPIAQLAAINVRTGPPAIKSEGGLLQAIVYVDLNKGQDVGGYVERARKAMDEKVSLPPGYYISWSGQYEYMVAVNKKLRFVVPLTLLIIFLLLYFNFHRLQETAIVMLSLPFALVGSVWFMYLLGYNMSVASGVGFIALAGLAVEMGVVMLLFLNLAYEEESRRGGPITAGRVHDAIVHGAVMRVRPKIMTVATTIMGLLPLMWMTGAGAQPMSRMAAPMIGGLVSSTVLTLIVIPAIYAIWKTRTIRAGTTAEKASIEE
jgi:Cu/Ag efflux pump CusA